MKQKQKHDAHAHERLLREGDPVLVRNYLQGDKWLAGTIAKKTGPVSYAVTMSNGRDRRCHQDQVRKRFVEIDIPVEEKVDVGLDLPTPHVQEPEDSTPIEPDPVETDLDITPKTYPRRERKPVERFEPTWN